MDQTNAYAVSLTGLSDSDFSSALLGYFSGVVTSALPEVYAVLDSTYSSDSDAPLTELIGECHRGLLPLPQRVPPTPSGGLSIGQAAGCEVQRLRPDGRPAARPAEPELAGRPPRSGALNDLKRDELTDALAQYGASLEHNLSSSAMNKMPAARIVNSSSSFHHR